MVVPIGFHPHPEVWVLTAALLVGWMVAVRRFGPRLAAARGEPVVTMRQRWQFVLGVGLVWGFAEWPVHDLAEDYLFSVHMVQHTIFSLIAPPLLVMGTPPWLRVWIVERLHAGAIVRRVARPLVAALLFNGVVAISHWPAWVDATLRSEPLHFGAHLLLFTTSVLMWLPVVNHAPGLPTMAPPMKMLYLFLQSVVPTVPASFLTFAERPLYEVYARAPRISGMSAVEDQQVAGGIMKVGGTAILWTCIVVVFFRWYAASQRGDVLTWEDVEREFARTEPASQPH